MPDITTASPAGAAALPAAPVAAPAPTAPAAPAGPITPIGAEPFKSAQQFIETSPDALAARYGIALDGEQPATEEPSAALTAPAPAEPAAPSAAEPAGAQPDAPTSPTPEPITKFAMYDEQGEFAIPMNVKMSFEAGGKEYKDLRLDEVVRMAQRAPLADKHRQDAEQMRPVVEQAQQLAQAFQQLQSEFAQNNALYEQLLANPALYQEAVQAYQQHNSPEQRVARAEQAMRTQQTQHQQQLQHATLQQATTAAATYTATRIAPRVDALTTQYPQVDAGDVMAKFHELTAPLLAPSPSGGVWVPPNRVTEIETAVLPQLESWAKARAARTTASTKAVTDAASQQVQKAQLDAQLAKRQLTRPLTPAGTPPMTDAPRPRAIKSASDAVDAIVDRAKGQIRGAA